MIDKTKLSECVERALEGSDLYIVDITVSPDNVIDVEIDGDSAVDIDACVKVNRAVEAEFDRDVEVLLGLTPRRPHGHRRSFRPRPAAARREALMAFGVAVGLSPASLLIFNSFNPFRISL